MEVQTGVKIGHTCLHRLVEKLQWSEPHAKIEVKETSIDGGKVRLRGKLGGKDSGQKNLSGGIW